MIIKKLAFSGFRNLNDDSITPNENINVIWGNNAQGKTNLLEAIWLFTGGHSFRGNKDSELPKIGGDGSARLDAEFFSEMRDQKASLIIKDGRRSSVINGIVKKTGSALVGKICAVIFSPEHLLLVKDGPQKRRTFIDGAICQVKPAYTKLIAGYNRSLLQRNTLLKDIFKHPELMDTMEVWDERLIVLGAQVIRERVKYIEKLAPRVAEIYKGISKDREKIELKYVASGLEGDLHQLSDPEIEDLLRNALKKNRQADLRAGFTTVGPHRDDVDITLDGLSARTYGSQGQQRSVVLSLKLAEADILEENLGEAPLVLLDDVMSELDGSRQDYLLNHLSDRQVFITCCSPETLNLMEKGKSIYVENGKVE